MVNYHRPVMVATVVELLQPAFAGTIVDATVGDGGHAEALLQAGATFVIGVDRDRQAIEMAQKRLSGYPGRFHLVTGNFRDLPECAGRLSQSPTRGVLFDLGVSSRQLDQPERGFSFDRDGPLDMRMEEGKGKTAALLLNESSEEELARIFKEYGDEPLAGAIARAMVRERDRMTLERTSQLRKIIFQGLKHCSWRRAFQASVRVFQAVRMVVNQERENLSEGLVGAWKMLEKGGRLIVLSYHSGEDRIVKRFILHQARLGAARALFEKPVAPAGPEVRANPRARSAKLRAVEKL